MLGMTKAKPKKRDGHVFSFRMSREEWTILERLADNESRTPSNFLRKLIADENARSKMKR